MATQAKLGKLSTLQLSDNASPEVFTTIAEVRRVGPIGSSNPLKDVTNLDSPAMEYIAGLADGSELDFTMNWRGAHTQQVALRTAVANGSTVHLKMVWTQFSPNFYADFQATALDFFIDETAPGEAVTASCRVKITGSITWG